MGVMGCLGSPDDGTPTGSEPESTATTEANEALTEAPAAVFTDRIAAVTARKEQLLPFNAQLEEQAGTALGVRASFDANRALALEAFRTRLGVQR